MVWAGLWTALTGTGAVSIVVRGRGPVIVKLEMGIRKLCIGVHCMSSTALQTVAPGLPFSNPDPMIVYTRMLVEVVAFRVPSVHHLMLKVVV